MEQSTHDIHSIYQNYLFPALNIVKPSPSVLSMADAVEVLKELLQAENDFEPVAPAVQNYDDVVNKNILYC